jgi:hypothetical protein
MPQIRLHPDAAAVEVQALYRGVVIGSRCLTAGDARAFLIGCAKGVDAPAAAGLLAADAHPLVSSDAGGFSVELTEQMTGTVIFEDRTAPLDDLLRAGSFTAPPAARLQITCGDVAFLVGATTRPPQVPRPALTRLRDHWPWLIAGLGALLVLLLVAFLPPDMMSLSGEVADSARRPPIIVVPPEPRPAPTVGHVPGGAAPRAAGGGTGSPTRRPQAARPPTRPHGSAPQDARHAGIIGVLLAYNRPGADAVAALLSENNKLETGSFEGLIDGSGTGPGGTGIGLGVSGPGEGSNGGPLVGDFTGATIGACNAECQARTIGALRGPGELRGHKTVGPQIIVSAPTTQGSLDKEIVRRIIRQHLNEVKYCYELQLPRHPDLAGRIVVQFTIAPTGGVAASLLQTSTLNNIAVESCIVQAVRRWEFPRRDAGMTIVSYPFVLVPAGAN